MNFSPFGNAFSASISGIHQFAAGAQVSAHALVKLLKGNLKCGNISFPVCRIHRIDITTPVRHHRMQQIWTIAINQTFRYCRNFAAMKAYKSTMGMATAARTLAAVIISQMCHIHHRPIYIRAAMISNACQILISSQTHPICSYISHSPKSLKIFAMHFWTSRTQKEVPNRFEWMSSIIRYQK